MAWAESQSESGAWEAGEEYERSAEVGVSVKRRRRITSDICVSGDECGI